VSNHEVTVPFKQAGTLNVSKNRYGIEKMQSYSTINTWLIEGAYQWYQHEGQGLPTPDAVTDLTRTHRDAQDAVGLWLDECCERKTGEFAENS
jgi:phage/plasmid-associated DNA primase